MAPCWIKLTSTRGSCRHRLNVLNLYRPQTKLQKGNVFTPVCQSFCSQGEVCLSAYWDSHPLPPGQTPPCPVHAGIHTPLPSACWDTPPCPVHVGIHSAQLHAGIDMATAADRTHPSGMHSCMILCFSVLYCIWNLESSATLHSDSLQTTNQYLQLKMNKYTGFNIHYPMIISAFKLTRVEAYIIFLCLALPSDCILCFYKC